MDISRAIQTEQEGQHLFHSAIKIGSSERFVRKKYLVKIHSSQVSNFDGNWNGVYLYRHYLCARTGHSVLIIWNRWAPEYRMEDQPYHILFLEEIVNSDIDVSIVKSIAYQPSISLIIRVPSLLAASQTKRPPKLKPNMYPSLILKPIRSSSSRWICKMWAIESKDRTSRTYRSLAKMLKFMQIMHPPRCLISSESKILIFTNIRVPGNLFFEQYCFTWYQWSHPGFFATFLPSRHDDSKSSFRITFGWSETFHIANVRFVYFVTGTCKINF